MVASAVNWGSRFALSPFMSLGASVIGAYLVGMIVGFWLYRQWVFPRSSLNIKEEAVRFCVINAIGLCAVTGLTAFLVQNAAIRGFQITSLVVALCHGASICAASLCNFLGHNFFTFSKKPAAHV